MQIEKVEYRKEMEVGDGHRRAQRCRSDSERSCRPQRVVVLEAEYTSMQILRRIALDVRSDNRERVPGVKAIPADAFWSVYKLPLPVYHPEYATDEPWMRFREAA